MTEHGQEAVLGVIRPFRFAQGLLGGLVKLRVFQRKRGALPQLFSQRQFIFAAWAARSEVH